MDGWMDGWTQAQSLATHEQKMIHSHQLGGGGGRDKGSQAEKLQFPVSSF